MSYQQISTHINLHVLNPEPMSIKVHALSSLRHWMEMPNYPPGLPEALEAGGRGWGGTEIRRQRDPSQEISVLAPPPSPPPQGGRLEGWWGHLLVRRFVKGTGAWDFLTLIFTANLSLMVPDFVTYIVCFLNFVPWFVSMFSIEHVDNDF